MTHVVAHAARPETREQRSWYWYDWANSAYVTTTATVLIGPYLTAIAKEAACPGIAAGQDCTTNLDVLGIPVSPGSVYAYTVTVSTLVSALVLIVVGAIADRSPRPTRLFAGFAWAGAAATHSIRRVPVAGPNPVTWRARIDARIRLNDHAPIALEGEK